MAGCTRSAAPGDVQPEPHSRSTSGTISAARTGNSAPLVGRSPTSTVPRFQMRAMAIFGKREVAREKTGSQLAFARLATALAAVSIGAFAVGTFAIGRLAIQRLAIRGASVKRLHIGELDVDRLRVKELIHGS
jgi:hypothetical protein